MKTKITSTFLFCCFTLSIYAQSDSICVKASQFKWEISASMNSVEAQTGQFLYDSWGYYAYTNVYGYMADRTDRSFSMGITTRYSIRDKVSLQCELGFTNIYITSHYDGINDTNSNAAQNLIKNDTVKQQILRFAPGIQWTILSNKYIQTYCGMSVNYVNYSKSSWQDNLKNNVPGEFDRWTGSTPGGFAAGVGLFAGFNINICKRIGTGAGFSSSLLYYKIGGIQIGSRSFTAGPNNDVITREWSITNNVSKGFQFSKVMPSLHVLIHF